jgi:hypothetical protein
LTPTANGYTATVSETALRAISGTVGENNSFIDNYNVYAVYSGDNYYVPETSGGIPLVIVGAPATQATCVPATCAANTTGSTFSISPANPAITITSTNAGPSNGLVVLNVISYGGWTGVLNFTCSNLPKYATCNPYPGAPLIADSTPSAPQPPTQVQFFINTNVAPIVPTGSSLPLWTGALFGLLLLLAGRKSGRARLRKVYSLAGMALLMAASLTGLSGCGSSSAATPFVTPAGTYTVNVAVSAARLNPSLTNGGVLLKDANSGSFSIALTVK